MSSKISMRSTAPAVGRLGGCLWLVVAAFSLMFILGAAGVSIDASFLFLPLTVLPFLLGILVLIRGRSTSVLVGSAVAAAGYATLGTWNYFRAAAFEVANPGSMEISGHEVSIAFVLLCAMTAAWSLAAAWLATWRRQPH